MSTRIVTLSFTSVLWASLSSTALAQPVGEAGTREATPDPTRDASPSDPQPAEPPSAPPAEETPTVTLAVSSTTTDVRMREDARAAAIRTALEEMAAEERSDRLWDGWQSTVEGALFTGFGGWIFIDNAEENGEFTFALIGAYVLGLGLLDLTEGLFDLLYPSEQERAAVRALEDEKNLVPSGTSVLHLEAERSARRRYRAGLTSLADGIGWGLLAIPFFEGGLDTFETTMVVAFSIAATWNFADAMFELIRDSDEEARFERSREGLEARWSPVLGVGEAGESVLGLTLSGTL